MKSKMKVLALAGLVAVGVIAGQGASYAEVKPFIKAEPVSFLASPNIDGMTLTDGYYTELLEGGSSYTPMLIGGLNFDTEKMSYDAGVGITYLYNSVFSSFGIAFEGAARYKLFEFLEVGPHLMMISFTNPEWDSYTYFNMDKSFAIGGGISFAGSFGVEGLKVIGSIDYINGEFELESSGWRSVRRYDLDYSGVLVKLGVQYAF